MLPLPNHRLDANDRPGLFIQSKKRHTVVLRAWKKNTQIHVNVHKSCRLDDSDELLWNYVGSAIQLDQHLLGRLYRIWLYRNAVCGGQRPSSSYRTWISIVTSSTWFDEVGPLKPLIRSEWTFLHKIPTVDFVPNLLQWSARRGQ